MGGSAQPLKIWDQQAKNISVKIRKNQVHGITFDKNRCQILSQIGFYQLSTK